MDYSIETANAAYLSGDVIRAGMTVDYINSMQKFSNISLIAGIAAAAFVLVAAVLASELLLVISGTVLMIGVGIAANIRFKKRPEFERAIAILQRMSQIIIQGGETICGLYMNAYKFEVL